MTVTINLQARHLAAVAVIAAAVVFAVWWASPARSATAGPDPVDTFAVVARADNPVDALAASSVAGQLGAPVYLTSSDTLGEQARQGLVDTAPDVVVLAGGTAALSEQVEDQIGELLPNAQLRRFAGTDRTETARLVNQLPGQLGIDRPVLAGATVTGDVGIDGQLTVAGTDIGAALQQLTGRLDSLESALTAANSRIGALESQVDGLQTTLDGVTRTSVDGRDTLRFEAMNLQLVNGTGTTDGTPNGEGNLIIGYNTPRPFGETDPAVHRAGSHYLIVGDRHHWTRFGGIVAGLKNTASGDWASVTGGDSNTASGIAASVTGGANNTASGAVASVSGGVINTASGSGASVTGGSANLASGFAASVSGGRDGTVFDSYDSRIGNTDFPDS